MRRVLVLFAALLTACPDPSATDGGTGGAGGATGGGSGGGVTGGGVTGGGVTGGGVTGGGVTGGGVTGGGVTGGGVTGGGVTGGGVTGGGVATGGGATGGGVTGGGSGGGATGGGGGGTPCAFDAGTIFAPHFEITFRDGGALPAVLLTSDRLDVRVLDLPPCRDVDLDFRLDAGHSTSARFTANAAGEVSTATAAPSAGPWSTVDGDAMFWTMRMGSSLTPSSHDLTITARWDGGAPFTTQLTRGLLPPGTTVTPFRETTATGLYGDFLRPPGSGPFPGVLVFGGSEGGLGGGSLTANFLVSRGFAVLAIAYFAVPGKPSGMTRIPLETFQRGLQRLRAMPDVRVGKIGILGVSRGGEAALLAGAAFSTDVDAVVSLVGGGYAWAAPGSSTQSTWTLDAGDVPFLPWPSGNNTIVTSDAGYTVSYGEPLFAAGLIAAGPATRLQAEIPVERINGPVLLLAASNDGIWPSCPLSSAAWNRLVDAGHTVGRLDELRCFAGAGHSMNPSRKGFPLVELIDRGSANPRTGYGGSAAVDNAADFELADRIAAFFQLALQ